MALERKILTSDGPNGGSPLFEVPRLAGDSSLAGALARLSEEDREVLLLTAWEGLTQKEAGQVLGVAADGDGQTRAGPR